jgi:hypothetical protein
MASQIVMVFPEMKNDQQGWTFPKQLPSGNRNHEALFFPFDGHAQNFYLHSLKQQLSFVHLPWNNQLFFQDH